MTGLGQVRGAGVEAARLAIWETELGELLSTAQMRELLGVASDDLVEEMLGARRLIGLSDSAGRLQFPRFQAPDRRPLDSLIAAFWAVADAAVSAWTAASWCAAPDDALDGVSPAQWARDGRDPGSLLRVAHQDAARLAQ